MCQSRTLTEWIFFAAKAFLQYMEYLRQGDENTEISTGCQCQSLALDSSKRGTRYKTGRKTIEGDKHDTMITMVMAQVRYSCTQVRYSCRQHLKSILEENLEKPPKLHRELLNLDSHGGKLDRTRHLGLQLTHSRVWITP